MKSTITDKVNTQLEEAIRALLFDQPVAYHPVIAHAVGSVTAGVFLSQLLYWTPRVPANDGWIWKTQEQVYAETGLTRKEQESARRYLREAGVLEERKAGVPARLFFRVNIGALTRLIGATKDAQNGQTGMSKTGNQAHPKRSRQSAQNGRPITEITSETTAEITNRDYSPSNSKGATRKFLADAAEGRADGPEERVAAGQSLPPSSTDTATANGTDAVRRVLVEKGLAPQLPSAPPAKATTAVSGFARAGAVLDKPGKERLSDDDLDRLRAELAEVADDLDDHAPAQSTLTRVVAYYHAVDMTMDGFTRAIHVAHARTKEDLRDGRVRDTGKAMAYFLSLLKQESEVRARQGIGKKRRSLAGKYAKYVRH